MHREPARRERAGEKDMIALEAAPDAEVPVDERNRNAVLWSPRLRRRARLHTLPDRSMCKT
jgi:hypothetical protein